MLKGITRGLLTATLAASLVGLPAIDADAAPTRVRVVNYRFIPARVSISRGGRVRWHNATSGTTHTITAYSGRWSKDTTLIAGASTSFRFRRRGLYKYYCSLHAHVTADGRCVANAGISTRMCGRVLVG